MTCAQALHPQWVRQADLVTLDPLQAYLVTVNVDAALPGGSWPW